ARDRILVPESPPSPLQRSPDTHEHVERSERHRRGPSRGDRARALCSSSGAIAEALRGGGGSADLKPRVDLVGPGPGSTISHQILRAPAGPVGPAVVFLLPRFLFASRRLRSSGPAAAL